MGGSMREAHELRMGCRLRPYLGPLDAMQQHAVLPRPHVHLEHVGPPRARHHPLGLIPTEAHPTPLHPINHIAEVPAAHAFSFALVVTRVDE